MAVIRQGNVIQGSYEYRFNGTPSQGSSGVDTITLNASGGTFTLLFNGENTEDISWDATNATLVANILAALNALNGVTSGDVAVATDTMTAGVGTITATWVPKRAGGLSAGANALTGGTGEFTVVPTTPGSNPTFKGAAVGAELMDVSVGEFYVNTGAPGVPVWTVIGSQS